MVLQAGFENSASVFRAMLIFKRYAEFPKKLADFFSRCLLWRVKVVKTTCVSEWFRYRDLCVGFVFFLNSCKGTQLANPPLQRKSALCIFIVCSMSPMWLGSSPAWSLGRRPRAHRNLSGEGTLRRCRKLKTTADFGCGSLKSSLRWLRKSKTNPAWIHETPNQSCACKKRHNQSCVGETI